CPVGRLPRQAAVAEGRACRPTHPPGSPRSARTAAEPSLAAPSPRSRKSPMHETRTFADFGLHPDLVAALADGGITHPFPIQSMTLPVALSRHDIIGQAKTGTGK